MRERTRPAAEPSRWQRWWYGPVFDVPELSGLPPRRQRAAWSEAVRRSTRPARLLALLAIRFACAVAFALLGWALWPSVSPLWMGLPGLICGGFLADALVTRPVAQAWLRRHAHELDRYVPR
jgi:hypothetical protein